MVFRYCLGMIMSVSTLMIFSGAATPSSVVNFSIGALLGWNGQKAIWELWFIANDACIKGQKAASRHRRLDGSHVVVGEAKMMPDLVDHHMANDSPQGLVVFGPVVQDRSPVEPDQSGQPGDVALALLRQADSLKQAEQVELAFRVHFVENFFCREILHPDNDALAQIAEGFRQPRQDVVRQGLHFGERLPFA